RAHRGAELRRAPDPALRDLVLRHALRVGGGVGPRAPLPTGVGNDDIGDVSRPLSMLPAWAALLAQPTPAVPNTPGFAATLRASKALLYPQRLMASDRATLNVSDRTEFGSRTTRRLRRD